MMQPAKKSWLVFTQERQNEQAIEPLAVGDRLDLRELSDLGR